MENNIKEVNIEQTLAEVDELLQQINAEIIKDTDERRRAQFEERAERLNKLKTGVEEKFLREAKPGNGSYSEGMHEAMDEIAKAMKELASYLS
jgi:hypothetical protein